MTNPTRFLTTLFVFTTASLFLTGCSFYSSAGRKQFEEKAPSQIVQPQGFTLLGCAQLSAAQTWLNEEFPRTDTEIVAATPTHEVWSKLMSNGSVEVTVLSKLDANSSEATVGTEATESCRYNFPSQELWRAEQSRFLTEVANASSDLD